MALWLALILQGDEQEFLLALRKSRAVEVFDEADRRLAGPLPVHLRILILEVAAVRRRHLGHAEAAERLDRDLAVARVKSARPWNTLILDRAGADDEAGMLALVAEGEPWTSEPHPPHARRRLLTLGYEKLAETREAAGRWKASLEAYESRTARLREISVKDLPPFGCGVIHCFSGRDEAWRRARCRFELGEVERALDDLWAFAKPHACSERVHPDGVEHYLRFEARAGKPSSLERRLGADSLAPLYIAFRDRDPAAFGRICATFNTVEHAEELAAAGAFLSRMGGPAIVWLEKGILTDDPAATTLAGCTTLRTLRPALERQLSVTKDPTRRLRLERALTRLSPR